MRIRILKALTGIVGGHSLSPFLPGFIYDVDETFGPQLVAMGAAIEVRATDPAVSDEIDMERLTGGVRVIPRDKVDDRQERRRRNQRRG